MSTISPVCWRVNNVSASVGSVLKPAGFEASQGIISAAYLKDATDPEWKNDKEMKEWNAFRDKYAPHADKSDASAVHAYSIVRTMVHVLKQCGNDLTRANIMKQAANLKNCDPGQLLPGIAHLPGLPWRYEMDPVHADRARHDQSSTANCYQTSQSSSGGGSA